LTKIAGECNIDYVTQGIAIVFYIMQISLDGKNGIYVSLLEGIICQCIHKPIVIKLEANGTKHTDEAR
jgi:hypothetical protein